jgi:hypothetical protein
MRHTCLAIIVLILPVAFLAACRGGSDPLAQDLARLCDCERLSGAAEQPPEQRMYTIAQWLGAELKTDEARQFLAQFQRTAPGERAALLRVEASHHGLSSCPLADTWSAQAKAPAGAAE